MAAHFEALLRNALPLEQSPPRPRRADELNEPAEYVRWLDEHDGHAVLLRLVAEEANEKARAAILGYFQSTYTPKDARPPSAQPAWSKIVRACDIPTLFSLALRDDAAIPEMVDFLESGEPLPGMTWEDRGLSPAYLEAMRKLLASPRPAARVFALEALSADGGDIGDEPFARFLTLAREDEDLHVREFALLGLVRSLAMRPERAREVTDVLARELARRNAMQTLPTAYLDSPLGKLVALGTAQRGHIEETTAPGAIPRRAIRARTVRPGLPTTPRPPGQSLPPGDSLRWIAYALIGSPPAWDAVYRQAFDRANSGHDLWFHEYLWTQYAQGGRDISGAFCSRLGEVSDRAFQEWIVLKSGSPCEPQGGRKASPEVEAFRKRVLNDRELSPEARWQVLSKLPWSCLDDAPAFFRGDDPVFARICEDDDKNLSSMERTLWTWVDGLEANTRLTILDAATASTIENARLHAAEHLPLELEGSRPLFERALKDPGPAVRAAAASRLNKMTRVDVAPLFHQLLGDTEPEVRLESVSALARIASPESLEPIGKLLDDPDTRVREKAFEALKTIRQRLDEKGEWRRILETFKTGGKDAKS